MHQSEHGEDKKAKRDRLRSEVVMPDTLDEMELNVDGPKEYRRNAYVMIAGGIFIIVGTVVVLVVGHRFFYVLPFVGLYLIGMGVSRLYK